jgi:hypothetical protein
MKRRVGYFWHQQSIQCEDVPKTFLHEADTMQCAHCRVTVVLNPERTRERALCHGCDRYLCDPCGFARSQGQRCVPAEQRALLALKYNDLALPFMDRGPMGELLFPEELLDKEKVF